MFSLLKRQSTRIYRRPLAMSKNRPLFPGQANTQNFDSNADFLAAYASY
jgi:hypothetical protein